MLSWLSLVNKILIPSILVVTIIVAGIFAFMPVEKATTVHTTITTDLGANIDKQDRVLSFYFSTGTKNLNDTSNANILPFKSAAWTGNATIIVSDGFGTCSVNTYTTGAGSADGSKATGATQTGVGASPPLGFTTVDRVEAIVTDVTECTIIILLDQTIE